MISVPGTYSNGRVSLDKDIAVTQPVKVIVTFPENINPVATDALKFSDFSFAKTRELLKDYKGSFADEVIAERRSEL